MANHARPRCQIVKISRSARNCNHRPKATKAHSIGAVERPDAFHRHHGRRGVHPRLHPGVRRQARATVRGARAVRAVSGLGSSAALAPRPSAMRALGLGVAPRRGARSADLAVRAMADEEKDDKGAGVKQLLGIRGGERTDDIWKIRLQLTKPVTWVPLIWGVMCGAAASGHYTWTPENVGKAMLCMFMSGPLLTGTHPATPIPLTQNLSERSNIPKRRRCPREPHLTVRPQPRARERRLHPDHQRLGGPRDRRHQRARPSDPLRRHLRVRRPSADLRPALRRVGVRVDARSVVRARFPHRHRAHLVRQLDLVHLLGASAEAEAGGLEG